MEFTTTVEIAADAATVWEALGQPENWPLWMDTIKDVTPKNPGSAPGYGVEYTVKQAWWKLDNQKVQLRDYEPMRRLAYSATTISGEMLFDYTIRELGPGRVAVDQVMRMSDGFAKLSGWLGGGQFERTLVEESIKLRDHCEARSPQDVVRG